MLINCPVCSVLCYLCLPVQMSITGQRIERACISDRKMLQVLRMASKKSCHTIRWRPRWLLRGYRILYQSVLGLRVVFYICYLWSIHRICRSCRPRSEGWKHNHWMGCCCYICCHRCRIGSRWILSCNGCRTYRTGSILTRSRICWHSAFLDIHRICSL